MADGIVSTDPFVNLYLDHADIRREASEHTSDIRMEAAKNSSEVLRDTATQTANIRHDVAVEAHKINSDVKDGQWKVTDAIRMSTAELTSQIDSDSDRIAQRAADYFIATNNKLSDTATQLASVKAATDFGFARMQFDLQTAVDKSVAASQLEAAKLQGAIALGNSVLERSLLQDGNETRRLLNELDRSNLERQLIERNADLHGHRSDALHWRGEADRWRGAHDQSQFAALSSQMQAVNSNVASTRSDLINFGNMAGVGQSTTSNQVR